MEAAAGAPRLGQDGQVGARPPKLGGERSAAPSCPAIAREAEAQEAE
jgi:hypothetical protein